MTSNLDTATLTKRLKQTANELGFQLAGTCPAVTPAGFHRFLDWLDLGYAGEMDYLASRKAAYQHPSSVLDGVTSILMLGMNYQSDRRQQPGSAEGSIASYAWGAVDYHDLIHDRLKQLRRWLQHQLPSCRSRGVVDTAPLLEREFAQLAGLGWAGKNTLLLNKSMGSYFFLAALLTDVQLEYDDPFTADHCGTCTACLDACPTHAFPQAYVLDATRCISYLTIEHRGEVPEALRGQWEDWLFGCDICQEVCPWNQRTPSTPEHQFAPLPEQNPMELGDLFYLDDEQFRARFRRTPLWRPKRRGLLRNAALLLGSQRAAIAKQALEHGLHDHEPIVREACKWALSRML